MRRTSALELMVRGMHKVLPCPVTVKMRTAIHVGQQIAHNIIPQCAGWGADMVTVSGVRFNKSLIEYGKGPSLIATLR